MIKFFRKIRQNLLMENKTGKYFKYAIGEIVLVVIGILIALSINNWNEQRKLKIEEIEILKDFKSSLEVDLLNVNQSIRKDEIFNTSIEILLTHLENHLSYSDSLKFHFSNISDTWTFTINESVFQSLKSEGLALISNKRLRQEIVNLYATSVTNLMASERYRDLLEEASTTILNTRFDAFWNGNYKDWSEEEDVLEYGNYKFDGLKGEMIPLDYEKLKNDQEFLYFLKSLKNRRFWHVGIKNNISLISITEVLKSIELELEEIR